MGDRDRVRALSRPPRRRFPVAGLVLLTFGALTEAGALALIVLGVALGDAGMGVFGGTVVVWVGALWLMVLSGVRDDWPAARRKARE